MTTSRTPKLILASGSRYRRDLLARLGLDFGSLAPDIDEGPLGGENASAVAVRLAQAKAMAVACQRSDAVVIGSDQTAALTDEAGTTLLGKPGTLERAQEQLQAASEKIVSFHTAVSVICEATGISMSHCDLTSVHFRRLDADLIDRYLASEDVLDCAGSFKSEGRGVVLFERIETQDPTALIGLPMIWLSGTLRELGFMVP